MANLTPSIHQISSVTIEDDGTAGYLPLTMTGGAIPLIIEVPKNPDSPLLRNAFKCIECKKNIDFPIKQVRIAGEYKNVMPMMLVCDACSDENDNKHREREQKIADQREEERKNTLRADIVKKLKNAKEYGQMMAEEKQRLGIKTDNY